jgi:uncharacterized protein with HEPN domain
MSEKDKANLLAIVDSCTKIQGFVKDISDADGFYDDGKTFDAVLMNFVVIGEAVARLSDEIKQKEKHIPWPRIKGLRNMVAHDYFGVDAEEVWQIVQNNLPELIPQIHAILYPASE